MWFDIVKQRTLQALADEVRNRTFVLPDGAIEFLSVDPALHMESEYGIFVSDAGKDQERLDSIKQLSQAMLQNGSKVSTIAEMLETTSLPQMKAKMKAAERAQEELEQAQQQAQQQSQEQMQQQQIEQQQQEVENANIQKEKDRQTKIEIALINAESKEPNTDDHSFDMKKLMAEQATKNREVDIKEKELAEEVRSNKVDESIDRVEAGIKNKEATIKGQAVNKANNANK